MITYKNHQISIAPVKRSTPNLQARMAYRARITKAGQLVRTLFGQTEAEAQNKAQQDIDALEQPPAPFGEYRGFKIQIRTIGISNARLERSRAYAAVIFLDGRFFSKLRAENPQAAELCARERIDAHLKYLETDD